MVKKSGFLSVLFLSAVLLAQAQQQGGHMGPEMGEDGERMLGMGRMASAAPVRSEEDFILEMIPHHLEAIDAAILVYATTGDPQLRRLAEEIYRAQFREVEDLKLFYARTYRALPAGRRYLPMMRDLNAVTGEARDVRFVQDMIPHHQGAVTMARQALEFPELSAEMRAFAEQVVADQGREIQVMEEWLDRRAE